jgi:hypothetical protein
MVARRGESYQLCAWSSTGPIAKTKLSRAGQSGCLTFQLAVGAGRSRRKTETVISEELQVRGFHGDSLPEIGALAGDEAVKLRSVMQEQTVSEIASPRGPWGRRPALGHRHKGGSCGIDDTGTPHARRIAPRHWGLAWRGEQASVDRHHHRLATRWGPCPHLRAGSWHRGPDAYWRVSAAYPERLWAPVLLVSPAT